MSAQMSTDGAKGKTDAQLIQSALAEIRACLEQRKARLFEEIRNYPPPIPACDQQFNYLLEQRAKTAEELGRLDSLSSQNTVAENIKEQIEEFIASSAFLNDTEGQRIRTTLHCALSKLR